MTWDPNKTPVDYILLEGKKSPGIAEVTNAAKTSKLKKLEPNLASKGFVVFRGIKNADFSVELRLYNPQDWSDWHAWKSLVLTPPKRATSGLRVWHPLLEELGISAVLVESVRQPKQAENGVWTIKIDFAEFQEPRRESKTINAAAKSTPVDPIEQQIDALTSQFQALAGPRPPPLPVRR